MASMDLSYGGITHETAVMGGIKQEIAILRLFTEKGQTRVLEMNAAQLLVLVHDAIHVAAKIQKVRL